MTELKDFRSDLDQSDPVALERARLRLRAAQRAGDVPRRVAGRPRHVSRRSVMLTLIALLAGGSATAATLTNNPNPGPSDQTSIDRQSAAIHASDAQDPRGGPPWAVKEYQATDGRLCAKPGRRVGSDVGSLQGNGSLAGTDISEGGDCVDVDELSDAEPIAWHINTEVHDPRTGAKAPVTYIWGLARPDVKHVTIAANGTQRTSAFGPNRGFIAVFDGAAMGESVKFTLEMADGTNRIYATPELGRSQQEALRKQLTGSEPSGAR